MASSAAFVQQLLQSAPQSGALSLAGQRLSGDAVAALMPMLKSFPRLAELDLADNDLEHIADVAQLTHLHRLDLSGNRALNAIACAEKLAHAAGLRHLSLGLSGVEEERDVLRMLPQLHTLNGHDAPARLLECTRMMEESAGSAAHAAAPAAAGDASDNGSSSSGPLSAPDITLVGADLEPVATLFDSIRNLLPAEELAAPSAPAGADPATKARHLALRLDTFEAHINGTVVALNDTLSGAAHSAPILRHAAILQAKQQLFDVCAAGLVAHARVLQPPFADALESLRAAESALRSKHSELLAYLSQEFAFLQGERSRANERVQAAEEMALATQRRALEEQAALVHRYESSAVAGGATGAAVAHRLETERAAFHKEKKALVTLVESLDTEVAALKSRAAAAAEGDRALREQIRQREQYWMEREAKWELRLTAAQQVAAGAGAGAGAAGTQQPSPVQAPVQPMVLPPPQPQPQPAPAPLRAAPEQQQEQGQGSAEPAQSQHLQQQQHQQSQSQSHQQQLQPHPARHHRQSSSGGGGSDSFYQRSNSSSPAQSQQLQAYAPVSAPSSHRAPFTGSDASLPNPLPSAQFHPSTVSQALTLHNHTQHVAQQAQGQNHGAGAMAPHESRFAAPPTHGRSMTLRQIKDMISEIYLSYSLLTKSWIASHNKREESVKETMLQHMYTYLNHKFGLKSLIIDAANSLLRGLTAHASDHTVAVFAGILRHTLDYDFRLVEGKTRKSVRELLRAHLSARHPLKRDHVLQSMLAARTSPGGALSEEEYAEIVGYMFAPVDRAPILDTIRAIMVQRRTAEIQQAQREAFTAASKAAAAAQVAQLQHAKLSVPYATFVHILLDFQLHVHRKFLEPFVSLFRQLDTMHSGLLSYDQFARLVATLNPRRSDEEIRAFLARADPFQHRLVSFSDCVVVLQEDLKALALRFHRQQNGQAQGQQQQQQEEEEEAEASSHPLHHHHPHSSWQVSASDPSGGFTTPAPAAGGHSSYDDSDAYADPAYDEYDPQPHEMRQPFHVHGQ